MSEEITCRSGTLMTLVFKCIRSHEGAANSTVGWMIAFCQGLAFDLCGISFALQNLLRLRRTLAPSGLIAYFSRTVLNRVFDKD